MIGVQFFAAIFDAWQRRAWIRPPRRYPLTAFGDARSRVVVLPAPVPVP